MIAAAPVADYLIAGGGVIGLALAYELSGRGKSVCLLDRGPPGGESSWAGAGMVPPASRAAAVHSYDLLRALSFEIYPHWIECLQAETGLDGGFRRCGAVYLARAPGEAAALRAWFQQLQVEQVRVRELDPAELHAVEPGLSPAAERGPITYACHLPDEFQVRNPRLMQALVAGNQRRGVQILADTEVLRWQMAGDRVTAVETNRGPLVANNYCLTAGAWTANLLTPLGISLRAAPIRGQIVLYHLPRPPLRTVVNEGTRYLVPRDDGRVLAGSTEEEAGFCKDTTPQALAQLSEFAASLVPELTPDRIERQWAGLRPGTHDGMPYLGRVGACENFFVAAGHFRSGVCLATGTAQVMADLMCGHAPEIDLAPFSVARG